MTALALTAALFYGVADFLGGAASRRASALSVLLVSVPIGLIVLAAVSALDGSAPTGTGLAWGFASGLASGVGFQAFYRALAKGPMSVVAPVSALAAAIVPVGAGLLSGEQLQNRVLLGVALCMIAIGLVSVEGGRPVTASGSRLDRGPVLAAVAGVCFGAFFVLIKQAGSGSGLWPLVASRAGVLAVIVMTVLVLAKRSAKSTPTGRAAGFRALRDPVTMAYVLGAGVLDVVANVSYFKASQAGLLSVVAVLTSLYPAITVLLARLVYSERLRTIQRLGLVVALTGVALVTAG
jgi:drug/metabolite transporter (DMT)-like permease